jgi:two-component system copper resistance phosphate regulon response regulator CusR
LGGASAAIIRLDSYRKSVYVGGASIPLTGKEYAVMSFLFSRRGEPVSREEITSAAHLGSSGTNTADVYVCRLRKKLYPLLGSRTIVTVRGKGYMLAV